jgi:hypothetical protein
MGSGRLKFRFDTFLIITSWPKDAVKYFLTLSNSAYPEKLSSKRSGEAPAGLRRIYEVIAWVSLSRFSSSHSVLR